MKIQVPSQWGRKEPGLFQEKQGYLEPQFLGEEVGGARVGTECQCPAGREGGRGGSGSMANSRGSTCWETSPPRVKGKLGCSHLRTHQHWLRLAQDTGGVRHVRRRAAADWL